MQTIDPAETLDVPAASKKLYIHPNTLMKLIQSGEIPAAKFGRAYVMLGKDVMAYAAREIIKQTNQRMGLPELRSKRACS